MEKGSTQPKCQLMGDWLNKFWYIRKVEWYAAVKKWMSNFTQYYDSLEYINGKKQGAKLFYAFAPFYVRGVQDEHVYVHLCIYVCLF